MWSGSSCQVFEIPFHLLGNGQTPTHVKMQACRLLAFQPKGIDDLNLWSKHQMKFDVALSDFNSCQFKIQHEWRKWPLKFLNVFCRACNSMPENDQLCANRGHNYSLTLLLASSKNINFGKTIEGQYIVFSIFLATTSCSRPYRWKTMRNATLSVSDMHYWQLFCLSCQESYLFAYFSECCGFRVA